MLPEGTDERVLRAADILLRRRVVELTLLGAEAEVRGAAVAARARPLRRARARPGRPGAASSASRPSTRQRRAHKGVTVDQARDVVTDVSYFGTMMVALGLVDGMVSGATHTTAETIRPCVRAGQDAPGRLDRLERVPDVPGRPRARLRRLRGQPEPDAEQLADIAISSAETAAQFGIEPRVAMLSYSTGASGSGAEVERVREATELVRAREPGAVGRGADPVRRGGRRRRGAHEAARTARSPGRATVFIFPDLNTGNNTYKAVQRSGQRDRDRPGPAGAQQAGQRPLARRDRARHRQHGRDHGDPGRRS